jgi:diaminopimelate decarboxylase
VLVEPVDVALSEWARRAATSGASSPFYLLDLDGVSQSYEALLGVWRAYFPKVRLAYPYKANALPRLTRQLRALGADAEVVTDRELQWAFDDGHRGAGVTLNGPVKSQALLARAMSAGCLIQADSLDEMEMITAAAPTFPHARLGLRLTHGIGQRMSRFGLLPEEAVRAMHCTKAAGLAVSSLHIHAGRGYPLGGALLETVCSHQRLIVDALTAPDRRVTLNVGGGFPAPDGGDDVYAGAGRLPQMLAQLLSALEIQVEEVDLTIEPGRSLVEARGVLVARIVARKSRPERLLLVCDARSELARSRPGAARRPRLLVEAGVVDTAYMLYGAHCYEEDCLAREVRGPRDVPVGALVVIPSTGAYDYASQGSWGGERPATYCVCNSQLELCTDRPAVAERVDDEG